MQGQSSTAYAYLRVSTDEQADSGLGLQAQRVSIEAECERRGWQLGGLFSDEGYSGKSLKRPAVQDALDALGEGDTLVIAKLDRLSRSVLDFAGLMDRANREGWAVVSLDCMVDTTTPQGRMMVNVLVSFAQFERELISQRIKEAMAVLKARGVKLGKPFAPLEVHARICREREAGRSLRRIAAGLNADGVPTTQNGSQWWASTVKCVLEQQR